MQRPIIHCQFQPQNAAGIHIFLGVDNQVVQNLFHAPPVCPHKSLLFRQLILQFKIGVRGVDQKPPGHRFYQFYKVKPGNVQACGPALQC